MKTKRDLRGGAYLCTEMVNTLSWRSQSGEILIAELKCEMAHNMPFPSIKVFRTCGRRWRQKIRFFPEDQLAAVGGDTHYFQLYRKYRHSAQIHNAQHIHTPPHPTPFQKARLTNFWVTNIKQCVISYFGLERLSHSFCSETAEKFKLFKGHKNSYRSSGC